MSPFSLFLLLSVFDPLRVFPKFYEFKEAQKECRIIENIQNTLSLHLFFISLFDLIGIRIYIRFFKQHYSLINEPLTLKRYYRKFYHKKEKKESLLLIYTRLLHIRTVYSPTYSSPNFPRQPSFFIYFTFVKSTLPFSLSLSIISSAPLLSSPSFEISARHLYLVKLSSFSLAASLPHSLLLLYSNSCVL